VLNRTIISGLAGAALAALSGYAIAGSAGGQSDLADPPPLPQRATAAPSVAKPTVQAHAATSASPVHRVSNRLGRVQTGMAAGSIDLDCGGRIYTVSTGDNAGQCSAESRDGVKSVNCDGSGGRGSANCAIGCTSASGSGSCSVKAR
jgi:hypothetical protein